MCRITPYKSSTCAHRWMTITRSCAPNVNFETAPVHKYKCSSTRLLTNSPKYQDAPANSCTICDLKGQYNGNTTRIVESPRTRCMQSNMYKMTALPVTAVGCGGGAAAAYGYPTFGTTVTNGRIVSAYQQQFAANKEAAAVMCSQCYPQQNYVCAYHRRNEESICGVM